MRYSLIIPTIDRPRETSAFLDSLLRQGPIAAECEVLLVDQSQDDIYDAVVAEYADRLTIRHLRPPGKGVSYARNVGIDNARGEIVSIPDDDCEYLPDFLNRVDRLLREDPSLDGLTCNLTADRGEASAGWREPERVLDRITVTDRCQEFCIFVKRQVVGDTRFNEFFGSGAGTWYGSDEGPDFLIRVMRRGAKLAFFPRLHVWHPDKIARTNRSTLFRAASYARGRGTFFRMHRYPASFVARRLVRAFGGSAIYLALLKPGRSLYYLAIGGGMLRGLLTGRRELDRLIENGPGFNSRRDASVGLAGALSPEEGSCAHA